MKQSDYIEQVRKINNEMGVPHSIRKRNLRMAELLQTLLVDDLTVEVEYLKKGRSEYVEGKNLMRTIQSRAKFLEEEYSR